VLLELVVVMVSRLGLLVQAEKQATEAKIAKIKGIFIGECIFNHVRLSSPTQEIKCGLESADATLIR
jgi:hypothetical protein